MTVDDFLIYGSWTSSFLFYFVPKPFVLKTGNSRFTKSTPGLVAIVVLFHDTTSVVQRSITRTPLVLWRHLSFPGNSSRNRENNGSHYGWIVSVVAHHANLAQHFHARASSSFNSPMNRLFRDSLLQLLRRHQRNDQRIVAEYVSNYTNKIEKSFINAAPWQ